MSGGMGTGLGGAMRGLHNFIRDVRASQTKDKEQNIVNKEMAKIRQKFKDSRSKPLDGYNRKKYVCKLMFMYILGYEVDFGHMEAIDLMSSLNFSEKGIGYQASVMMLHEEDELVRLIINSIQKDLLSRNLQNQCLALTAAANIGGAEIADALAPHVQKVLVNPYVGGGFSKKKWGNSASDTFVKKKAALCLLRMYRKNPSIMPADEWVDRMSRLLEDEDWGVLTCISSLLLGLVSREASVLVGLQSQCLGLLQKLVLDRQFNRSGGYSHYDVPNPWLQIKLLRILQYFPPPTTDADRTLMREILNEIMSDNKMTKVLSHNNAMNAVLFEAISLVVHLNDDNDMLGLATQQLVKYLKARETNLRYLSLEAMARMCIGVPSVVESFRDHRDIVLQAMKEKDISVRRRALDLIYVMCDETNVKIIVDNLLNYLVTADFQIREELVLKIAILVETFAPTLSWFVDKTLHLISIAGDAASEDIWYRVVQIVTNNDSLQLYAAQQMLSALRNPGCPETTIKAASYILGEFGKSLVAAGECPVDELFKVMHTRFVSAALDTRAVMLNAYSKLAVSFPELAPLTERVLTQHVTHVDLELQQRSVEYLTLHADDEGLAKTVLEEMPTYGERESSVLARLRQHRGEAADAIIDKFSAAAHPKVEGSGIAKPVGDEPQELDDVQKPAATNVSGGEEEDGEDQGPSLVDVEPTRPKAKKGGDSLLMLEEEVAAPVKKAPSGSAINDLLALGTLDGAAAPKLESEISPQVEARIKNLARNDAGVLYEDDFLQIGVRSEYHGHQARFALFYGAKQQLTGFRAGWNGRPPQFLRCQVGNAPIVIQAREQKQQMFMIECLSPFEDVPEWSVQFVCQGRTHAIHLKLPIFPHKFVEGVRGMTAQAFFAAWRALNGKEAQAIVPAPGELGLAEGVLLREALSKLRATVLPGVDQNPLNSVAAGTWCGAAGQRLPLLVRLELNSSAKMSRVTVRCSAPAVCSGILKVVEQICRDGK